MLYASDLLQDYNMSNENRTLSTNIYFYDSYGSVNAIRSGEIMVGVRVHMVI